MVEGNHGPEQHGQRRLRRRRFAIKYGQAPAQAIGAGGAEIISADLRNVDLETTGVLQLRTEEQLKPLRAVRGTLQPPNPATRSASRIVALAADDVADALGMQDLDDASWAFRAYDIALPPGQRR